MEELGKELVIILDYYNVTQVTCLAEGAGANVCARFAMTHPNRCMGLALVNPMGSSNGILNGILEHFKIRFNIRRASKTTDTLSSSDMAFLVFHKFGSDGRAVRIKEFQKNLNDYRNFKNLSMFIQSFLK